MSDQQPKHDQQAAAPAPAQAPTEPPPLFDPDLDLIEHMERGQRRPPDKH